MTAITLQELFDKVVNDSLSKVQRLRYAQMIYIKAQIDALNDELKSTDSSRAVRASFEQECG